MGGPRSYHIYLSINVAFGLAFMLYATIASVYRIQTVGLEPLQPVLADTYGRRQSVIPGFLLIAASFSFTAARSSRYCSRPPGSSGCPARGSTASGRLTS